MERKVLRSKVLVNAVLVSKVLVRSWSARSWEVRSKSALESLMANNYDRTRIVLNNNMKYFV